MVLIYLFGHSVINYEIDVNNLQTMSKVLKCISFVL